MEKYIPGEIQRIQMLIPDRVNELLDQYTFENSEKYIRYALKWYGIYENREFYADCYSNAALGYYYSICRCAYCDYSYVERYIRKMIRITIICGINTSKEVESICRENNLKAISFDELYGIDNRY
ncbi:MAG: hypothetical protein IKN47_06395 [Lachnospiraceae bacterium]|jgi:hypothetical protein|nr:hypothetical protein [Lachnospiraceae bacterium]